MVSRIRKFRNPNIVCQSMPRSFQHNLYSWVHPTTKLTHADAYTCINLAPLNVMMAHLTKTVKVQMA